MLFCLGFDIAGLTQKNCRSPGRKKALVVAGTMAWLEKLCFIDCEGYLWHPSRYTISHLKAANFQASTVFYESRSEPSPAERRSLSTIDKVSALEAAEAEHLASLSAVAIVMSPRRWLAYVGASGAFLGVEQWVLLKAWGERP